MLFFKIDKSIYFITKESILIKNRSYTIKILNFMERLKLEKLCNILTIIFLIKDQITQVTLLYVRFALYFDKSFLKLKKTSSCHQFFTSVNKDYFMAIEYLINKYFQLYFIKFISKFIVFICTLNFCNFWGWFLDSKSQNGYLTSLFCLQTCW